MPPARPTTRRWKSSPSMRSPGWHPTRETWPARPSCVTPATAGWKPRRTSSLSATAPTLGRLGRLLDHACAALVEHHEGKQSADDEGNTGRLPTVYNLTEK